MNRSSVFFGCLICVSLAGPGAGAQVCEYPIDKKVTCPHSELKQRDPATSNGCGPGGGFVDAAIRALTPNGFVPAPWNEQYIKTLIYYKVFGQASFAKACDTHDICYGTCGSEKLRCDDAFFTELIAACNTTYPASQGDAVLDQLHENCLARAHAYWQAVSLADVVTEGSSALPDLDPFQAAQDASCECCREKGPSGTGGSGGAGGEQDGGAAGVDDAGGTGGMGGTGNAAGAGAIAGLGGMNIGGAGGTTMGGSAGSSAGSSTGGVGGGPTVSERCGPSGDADRYEFVGDGSWDDLVYDTVTGLTWHRDVEESDSQSCTFDLTVQRPREEPYCCNPSPSSAPPGCNWLGFKQLCEQRGMRLATEAELYEFARNAGLCFNNWESWGELTGEWTAAWVTRVGRLVSSASYAIPESEAIWYASEHVRCVR